MALAVVLAAGAFLAIGALFDLITDARGNLPSDHSATFTAVAHIGWQHARLAARPITRYITRAEVAYASFELLFAVLFLTVVAIPLRRGERWAWRCCWLIILGFGAFGVVYGAHDSGNLSAAVAAAVIAALALLLLRPRPARSDGSRAATP